MSLVHWRPPVAIAHRGSRILWPENTMEAFSRAVALGYRHLETDLRITADGVLVCIHDDTVDRTTDATGPVSEFDYQTLSSLDAGFRHGGALGFAFRGRGVKVPTLEEVVITFPEASLVVDLKTDDLAGPLTALIDRLDLRDRLIVGSFSDARLAMFRAASGNRVATSTGATASRSWLLASRVRRGVAGEARALQLPRTTRGVKVVDRRLIAAAHDRGLQVHVWTVNTQNEMVELLDMGVDGLITDRPDLLKEVLVQRGEWNPAPGTPSRP
ncbi:MAG TPA: glycerophosphodiester phosphodiesterase [Acidimicrobiia bacterium]